MKLTPMNAPEQPSVHGAHAEITGGHMASARDRAIAALMKPNNSEQAAAQAPQATPVSNPSRIAPEEMSALRTKSTEPKQNYSNEAPESAAPVSEAAPKEEPLSAQYAALARREKAIRLREQQIKAKEAELSAPKAPIKAPEPSFDPSKYVERDKILKDPFATLNELGLTYDQLTERLVNAPSWEQQQLNNQVKALEAKLAEFESKTQESIKKSLEESQKQQYEQGITQIRRDVNDLIKNDASFETIRATNSSDDVVKLIERTFNEDGRLMSVEEAALEVENYLVEEAIKLAKLSKIQQKLRPAAPAEAPKATAQSEQQQLKTLTNSISSTRQLSAKERAVLAFQGKLSK